MLIWNFRFDRYGQSFRYQLHRRSGDSLIVFLPGLRSVESSTVEYYNRLTWSSSFGNSCLYVADPCLDSSRPKLRGSWFQGNREFFAIEDVSSDIRTILHEFGFSEHRTIVYGSSQGGFASLGIGAYLTGAKILAECPQSNIRLFNFISDTSKAAKFCYGVDSFADVPAEYDNRIDLIKFFQFRGFIPKSKVLVKKSDTHALDIHINPLQKAAKGRISVQVFDGELGEGGHIALPKEVVIDELNNILSAK